MTQQIYVDADGFRAVVVGVEDGRVHFHFHRHGGGVQVTAPEQAFYEDFKLETSPPAYRRIGVSIEGFDGVILRAYSNGERWNGWCMPYFEFDEANHIMDLREGDLRCDPVDEVFTFLDSSYPDEPYVYPAKVIEVDGQQVKVWGIGAGDWCWEEEKALPPDPDNVNDYLAAEAGDALTAFMRATGVDDDLGLRNLLGGLMHWCDRNEKGFDAELLQAHEDYLKATRP